MVLNIAHYYGNMFRNPITSDKTQQSGGKRHKKQKIEDEKQKLDAALEALALKNKSCMQIEAASPTLKMESTAARKKTILKKFEGVQSRCKTIQDDATDALVSSILVKYGAARVIMDTGSLLEDADKLIAEGFNRTFNPILDKNRIPETIYEIQEGTAQEPKVVRAITYAAGLPIREVIKDFERDIVTNKFDLAHGCEITQFSQGVLTSYYSDSINPATGEYKRNTYVFNSDDGSLKECERIYPDYKADALRNEKFSFDDDSELAQYRRKTVSGKNTTFDDTTDCILNFECDKVQSAMYNVRQNPENIGEMYIRTDGSSGTYCINVTNPYKIDLDNPSASFSEDGTAIGEKYEFDIKDSQASLRSYCEGVKNTEGKNKSSYTYLFL